MKRYRPDTTLMGEEAITEDNFGEYVKYSEVAIKIGESITSVEQANQAVLAASETIQKLVAENAAMRNALRGVMTHCPINDPDIDKACAAMICNDALQSTPNTDAAISDIKAQGVDDFASFILRDACGDRESERDVGEVIESAEEYAANLRSGRKG